MDSIRFFLLVFFTLTGCWVHAQNAVDVTGIVQEENGSPVPFANVALYSADSTLVSGAVSDESGNFRITAKPGRHYLQVSFLSFEKKSLPLDVTTQPIALGVIRLTSGTKLLESVEIQGERSQMELHLDKRVFEVGKDLSNISGTASDILDNVPSVNVDVDGNVSLRGSGNVRILIDGRPSGLTGISTADALQQLQGNLVERIEVITNPSARYDAEGEVGIINIILKKEKNRGLNGSATVNAGYPANYGASFNLNFRRNNVNYFGSYGISYRKSPGRGKSFQSFLLEDTTFFYSQLTDRSRRDLSHNIRGGIDFCLGSNQTLTLSGVVRTSESLNRTTNRYDDLDADQTLIRTVERVEREEEPELNSEAALSYRKDFNDKGRSFTADLKYIDNNETEYADFRQTDFSIDSTGFQSSKNVEDEQNVLMQMDYTHPFSSKGKFETGIKGTARILDNSFELRQLNTETNEWIANEGLSTDLTYDEKIYAAYVIVGNELNKFSWQTGLRGELTDIEVSQRGVAASTRQNYFNLFPSAHLSYHISQDKTLQLSYSYRLSRPRFGDLIPFSNFSDNRSVETGNPNLRPEYTNSLEAGYLINWEKGSLLSSTYYRYRTGVIEEITLIDSVGFSRTYPTNLGVENAYGLEFNLSYNPIDAWRLNANANFYRSVIEGSFNDQEFNSDTYTWTTRTTSKITFFRKWDFQTGFNYRAPRQTPQGRNRSLYSIDLGLSRDVLKKKGTLTLAVRDLLNSRKFRSEVERPDEGYFAEREFQGRVRQLLITFTYRINTRPAKNERNRDDNDDDDFDNDD